MTGATPIRGPATRYLLAGALLFDGERGARRGSLLVNDGLLEAELAEGAELPDAPRVAMRGRIVLPSFCDAHCHLLFAGLQKVRIDLSPARTKAHALALLRQGLERTDLPEAVLAEGWDESTWPASDGMPDRDALDAISLTRPIVARRACTHLAVANSRALPFFWGFERVDGATGRLYEDAAMKASRVLPGLPVEKELALRAALAEAPRQGVTEIHEFGKREDFEILTGEAAMGRLPLRVRFFARYEEWRARDAADWIPPAGSDFRVVGVKFFTDGSFGARTAALAVPYTEGGTGELLWEPGKLAQAYRDVAAAGLRPATHAIGDRAVALTLEALRSSGVRGGRVEHAELLPDDVPHLRETGVAFSMQPNFVARWAQPDGLYERVLGVERARRTNAFATLWREGPLAFGSDSMPMGPLYGLRGALLHPARHERLELGQALDAYTRGGRAVLGEGRGLIGRGQPADLVVLGATVFSTEAILGATVDGTMLGGRWVHRRSESDLEPVAAARGTA